MPIFTDISAIHLPASPRIVSLVPSLTELLYDLDPRTALVGLTRFCVHPEQWFRTRTRIGGTKDLKPALIAKLRPDLIIASREENIREQVQGLATDFNVWLTDVKTVADAIMLIRDAGALLNCQRRATALADNVQTSFNTLDTGAATPLRTAYLIWKNPYMTVGHDTYIHDVMERAGLVNVFGNQARYPSVDVASIRAAAPQLLLLSSEPYPFRAADVDELQTRLPGVNICLADGELFSWYGSRMQFAPEYLSSLLRNFRS